MPLRHTKPFKDITEQAISRRINFTYGPAADLDAQCTTAVYVNPDNLMTALSILDLAATAFLGAAAVLLPKGRAKDCIKARTLDDDLAENAAGVLDALTAALSQELAADLRLDVIYGPGARRPAPVEVLAGSPARLDFMLKIHGYGEGRLSVVSFP